MAEKYSKTVEDELVDKLKKCLSRIDGDYQELRSLLFNKGPSNLNDKEEFALFLKDGGNYFFKQKHYIDAVQAYTEGIDMTCRNVDIESSLFNNRSAANYILKKYRSALDDCECALALKPDHKKCMIRAANCCYELQQIQKCLVYCDKILQTEPDHKEILQLRQKCLESKGTAKEEVETEKTQDDLVLEEILKRNIKIHCASGSLCIEDLKTEYYGHRVHLDRCHNLIWPVVFVHHEFKQRVLIANFREGHTIGTYIFFDVPQLMRDSFYKLNNLDVYYCCESSRKVFNVDVQSTLLDILQKETFFLMGGIPIFHVVLKNSPHDMCFQFIKS